MMRVATPVGVHLLTQAAVWHAWGDEGQLVEMRLEDMTRAHQARVLAWLREHAVEMQQRAMSDHARRHRRGQLTDEEFGQEMRYLEALDPAVWIEETPLVRRLAQLVPREPARPPRRRFLRHPRRWWR